MNHKRNECKETKESNTRLNSYSNQIEANHFIEKNCIYEDKIDFSALLTEKDLIDKSLLNIIEAETSVNKVNTNHNAINSLNSTTNINVDELANNKSSIQMLIENNKNSDKSVKELLREILVLAIPTTLFFLCIYLQQTINLHFISKKFKNVEKDEVTDAIGISHLYLNCTLMSIVVGILSGFEILGGNAFGAKNNYLLGVYLHRAQIIGFIVSATIILVHWFTAIKVLAFFGLTENILNQVESYIKITMFLGFCEMQFSLNYRYLTIINKAYINLIITISTILLHPLWCYILIDLMDLKIIGAGFCLIISQGLSVLCGCFYIYIIKPVKSSIFFYNRDSINFSGLIGYLKIGLPNAFLLCVEWWSYEILALICLWIDSNKQMKLNYTGFVLVYNIYMLLFTFVMGYMMASSVLVSTYISEGKERITKKLIVVILVVSVLSNMFVSGLFNIFKHQIIMLFRDKTSLDEVYTKSVNSFNALFFISIFDSLQCVLGAACRGMRLHFHVTLIAFINFYLFIDGSAILFGKILDWQLIGVWFSVALGLLVSVILYSILLSKITIADRILHTLNCIGSDDELLNDKKD